jgi:hypothetical protein
VGGINRGTGSEARGLQEGSRNPIFLCFSDQASTLGREGGLKRVCVRVCTKTHKPIGHYCRAQASNHTLKAALGWKDPSPAPQLSAVSVARVHYVKTPCAGWLLLSKLEGPTGHGKWKCQSLSLSSRQMSHG